MSKTRLSVEQTTELTRTHHILTAWAPPPLQGLAAILGKITSGSTEKTRVRRAMPQHFCSSETGKEVSWRRQTAGDKRPVVWTDLRLNALWCSAGGIYAPTAAGSGCRIYLAPRDITAR